MKEKGAEREECRTTQIILDVLAYVASKYSVEIFSFVFMSNHLHMILRALELDLHRCMGDIPEVVEMKAGIDRKPA